MDKKKMKRKEIIVVRLKSMAERAKERREFLKINKLDENCYIRIRGEDFRAVSLNDKSALCGYSKGGAKKIQTILKHFNKKPTPLSEQVWKDKKERRIQCFLIKHALQNNGDLNSILNTKSKYDELIFCLDEVSLGDNNHKGIDHEEETYRCDILAIGIIQGKAVPILIELKSNRSQERLLIQLDSFGNQILKFKDEFVKLLSECAGRQVIISDHIKKMLIWPSIKHDKKDTIGEYHKKDIDVIEYDWNDNSPESIKFHFYPFKKIE